MKMDVVFAYTRLMLATLVVFGALQPSESIQFQRQPDNPTIVVKGVNSTRARLVWALTTSAGETITGVFFKIRKPGEQSPTQIASRTANGPFTINKDFKDRSNYEAKLDYELVIVNSNGVDKYNYFLSLSYTVNNVLQSKDYPVEIEVKEPPKITIVPTREPRLNIGQNYTLTCNASGVPHPNITWRKAGEPLNKFNASGYQLHLVEVQREDAGSYICTASNGYGQDATSISIVGIRCPNSQNCQAKEVGIRLRSEDWKDVFGNQASVEFENLESKLLSAIQSAYTKNPNIPLYRVDVANFRSGSVYATVELLFGNSDNSNLNPLRNEMNDGKLGSFTVDRTLDLDPTTPPTVSSTVSTTGEKQEPSDPGARGSSSGLTESEMWGIIGGCIAFVLLIVIIIVICCICKKRKTAGGASKGKSYSEADGYRMNRQPPPSGLSTASPAYVEARQYAPVSSARKQDDQSKPPLNYADLSFNNSSGRQPPPYSGTEYSEMSPEKRPPPAGGQQGEGGGFELWC